MNKLENFIYDGIIRHRRFTPFKREFSYRIFMTYLDLDTIDSIFKESIFWSIKNRAIVSFKRSDYHGDPSKPLADEVRKTIFEKTGKKISGSVKMLTHLRYFGFCFNPVTFYYCFNESNELEIILAEVTNTPWNERYAYVINNRTESGGKEVFTAELEKKFHVSPFWGMDHNYEWLFSIPDKNLLVNMKNFHKSEKVFDATLNLKRTSLNSGNLIKSVIMNPFITIKVMLMIHWQALILWIRRAPFFTHPSKIQYSGD